MRMRNSLTKESAALDAKTLCGVYTRRWVEGNAATFFRPLGGKGDVMGADRSFRRLPLRDLMIDAEKRVRDLVEHFNITWLACVADLRDLSRPIRKRSHYPTLYALQNALLKTIQTHKETCQLIDYLVQELNEILQHARREQMVRR
jgi:hypothetical protein